MKKKYICLLVMAMTMGNALASEHALAGDGFSLAGDGSSLAADGFTHAVFTNPAMQSLHHTYSLNTLSVGYDYRHASEPMFLEDGHGHGRAFAHIDAYLHKGKATLWGKARYDNGTTRGIRYNETSDWRELYPYLMADTVGGKSKQEHYHFLGGFSYPLGTRWNVAAEGEYRALMEYRQRDPRPKNLVGDLRVKVGASYLLDDSYLLGLALTARKYKQTNEVKLYNEVSVPTIYHLTGLGNDYYRFRGVNTSTYYKGYGVGGMLSLIRKQQKGWLAQAAYEYTDIDKIISSLNELPMANLKKWEQNVTVGYVAGVGLSDMAQGSSFGLKVNEFYRYHQGKENIFGAAQNNIYPQISEATPYRFSEWGMALQLLYRQVRHQNHWDMTLDGGYGKMTEKYLEPLSKMETGTWKALLGLEGGWHCGKRWLLNGNLEGGYEWATDPVLLQDGATPVLLQDGATPVFLQDGSQPPTLLVPVEHRYDYLSHDRWHTKVMAEANYRMARVMPFVRIDWQYDAYLQTQHQQLLRVSAGVKF